MMKVMCVGSWAKEQITVELLRKSGIEVYAYMDTNNPGIIPLVNKYKIGSLGDVSLIVSFAISNGISLAFITNGYSLKAGVSNALRCAWSLF